MEVAKVHHPISWKSRVGYFLTGFTCAYLLGVVAITNPIHDASVVVGTEAEALKRDVSNLQRKVDSLEKRVS